MRSWKLSSALVLVGLAAASLPASAQAPAAPAPGAPSAPAAAPAAAPPPPPPIAFDDAVLKAANDLFSKAQLTDAGDNKVLLAIDPLIDGISGAQSVATRSMEKRIIELVKASYPRFDVQPFNTATVSRSPVVLIGTFTAINAAGQVDGPRDAYRVCLALADLKSRKIVSKGFARAKPEGVDTTPTAYFNDSPVFSKDAATEAYIKSCQGTKAGDPINQVYSDRILAAAFISDAINAYNGKRYRESLDLYNSALRTPGGDQLRAYNGVYLASWKLARRDQAADAFGKVVDYGLNSSRLAVKFLFRPGSTLFFTDKATSIPYPMWLKQIAQRTAKSNSCLEIVGHTSPTGPEPLNVRLSGLRAERVKDILTDDAPVLKKRMIASGLGSKETLIGTGKDNASDALDRRVEFKVLNNC